jgi:hypothetical protein
MRSLSATLLAAQQAATNTPYIHLLFTSKSGGSTSDYSSNLAGRRIIFIDHNEEPYNDYATIILRNNDRTISTLIGYWTEIGYGYVTGVGNEYVGQDNGDGTSLPGTARLWVKHQQTFSTGGKLYELLELEGMWTMLREMELLLGTPPFYSVSYTTDTIYTILKALIETEMVWTLSALGTQDDTVISVFTPQFDINAIPYEKIGDIIYRLMQMTFSYLRGRAGLTMEVIFPQAADAISVTYYNDTVPYFYEYTERQNIIVPNHIYLVYDEDSVGNWNATPAESVNQGSIDAYADIPAIYQAAAITSGADANTRADVILSKIIAEAVLGTMLAPHDCQVELYDRIQVVDTRGY